MKISHKGTSVKDDGSKKQARGFMGPQFPPFSDPIQRMNHIQPRSVEGFEWISVVRARFSV